MPFKKKNRHVKKNSPRKIKNSQCKIKIHDVKKKFAKKKENHNDAKIMQKTIFSMKFKYILYNKKFRQNSTKFVTIRRR